MAIIQCDTDALDYVNAKLHPLAPRPGRFLELFLHCCLRADDQNYEILRPALQYFMEKYPADPKRLEMERMDRGAESQET